jgi:hypothetical protein
MLCDYFYTFYCIVLLLLYSVASVCGVITSICLIVLCLRVIVLFTFYCVVIV